MAGSEHYRASDAMEWLRNKRDEPKQVAVEQEQQETNATAAASVMKTL